MISILQQLTCFRPQRSVGLCCCLSKEKSGLVRHIAVFGERAGEELTSAAQALRYNRLHCNVHALRAASCSRNVAKSFYPAYAWEHPSSQGPIIVQWGCGDANEIGSLKSDAQLQQSDQIIRRSGPWRASTVALRIIHPDSNRTATQRSLDKN